VPGDRTAFHRTITADPLSVRAALADFSVSLTRLGIAPEHVETLELVVAEVLNNIVEHAYRDMPAGEIGIEVEARGGVILCDVTDGGAPMPGARLPQGAHPGRGTTSDDLPEGGYGWFLIRGLARDLTYARIGGRNVLRFRIDFPPSPAEF
jgi:serine/threonine-protein kinase RsbW